MQHHDPKITEPVVSSLAAAIQQTNSWLEQNDYHRIKDLQGTLWDLKVKFSLVQSARNTSAREWLLEILIGTTLTGKILMESQILNPENDMRIIKLLGDARVKVDLKPMQYHVRDESEGRKLLLDVVPIVKSQMEHTNMATIKRQLIGKWVDQNTRFGGQKGF